MGDIYALVSAGGAPGVTTTAIAIALAWPAEVVVAECDPSGGDILAGLLTGHVCANRGLMELAIEAGHDAQAVAIRLRTQLVPLDGGRDRMVLPGLTDPRQAVSLTTAWQPIANALTAHGADVVADCGRLDAGPGQPLAVLCAARVVALVLRPTLRHAWAARPRVDMLRELLGGSGRIALLAVGRGTHPARDIGRALGVPVAAVLPDDARTAAFLSDGAGARVGVMSSPLLRSARTAGSALRGLAAGANAELTGRSRVAP